MLIKRFLFKIQIINKLSLIISNHYLSLFSFSKEIITMASEDDIPKIFISKECNLDSSNISNI